MFRVLIALASCVIVSVASAGLMALADRQPADDTPPVSVAAPPASASAPESAPASAPPKAKAKPKSALSAPHAIAAGSLSADEAAARHAKRTVCLKDARARKLVGAQRTSYVKECVAAP